MIDIVPNNLIEKANINLWQYDKILDKYPIVKKCLGDKFKGWIENLSNPFEINWIRNLYNNNLGYLEENLINIVNDIQYANLKNLFNELPIRSRNPIEITRKINSISSEISAYKYLKKNGYKNIEKINKYGDWEYDNGIMSVKYKESIMDSYIYTENIIKGLAYIKENDIIRRYNPITLNKLGGLSYQSSKVLYEYIRTQLVEDLIGFDKILNKSPKEWKELSYSFNNYNIKIYLNSQIAPIQINISLPEEKNIELDFENTIPANKSGMPSIISVSTDMNAYWLDQIKEIELFGYVENKIKEACGKRIIPNILWIYIDLLPDYSKAINDKSEQMKYLDIINREHCIKTILSFNFYPNFGESNVILKSNKDKDKS